MNLAQNQRNVKAFAKINGIHLYYEVLGKGKPLMLVAGLGSDSQSWQPIIEELSSHFMLILPDNRGAGRTVPQDTDTSIRQIADDCIALSKHLGLGSFDLLGHSMGGFVALDLAIRYPHSVDRLILEGTAASNSKRNNALFSDWASTMASGMDRAEWFRNLFYWIFTEDFFEDEKNVEEALRYAVTYPYPQSDTAFRKQVEAIAAFDCSQKLSEIRAGTLIVRGEEDILFPSERSDLLARSISGASLQTIKNAAHSIHMEQPKAFGRSVIDFLAAPLKK
jgi:pimeloyl-ACP methyl ester carboxylesterase